MSGSRSLDSLVGDVVAFTALPAVWVGLPIDAIARSLAQALDRTMHLAAVAIVLRAEAGVIEARSGDIDRLAHDVDAWRDDRPLDAATLQVPIGPSGRRGVILLRGADLAADRILIARLAANLADTALREAALHQQAASSRAQLMKLEKLSALGQLVSGVAHELRTPLTYANNNIYLLQRRLLAIETLAADERAALEAMMTEVLSAHERIERTVGTLRRLSSPRAPHRDALRLSDAVGEATRLFSLTHVGPVAIRRELGSEALVDADHVQIQQIVLNLLQNAAEAVGESGTISVHTHDARGKAWLCVEDDGPGIPKATRDRIFDPFFTTKPGGTGLGLSIVRGIAEAHSATLHVGEGERGGALFELAFPILVAKPRTPRVSEALPARRGNALRT